MAKETQNPELEYQKWKLEVRRGALSLAILSVISGGQSYGYDIMKKLSEEKFNSLQVEPSTTYPLLKRLERRGMLEGHEVEYEGRIRRHYYITREGRRYLDRMVESWEDLNNQLVQLLQEAELL
ncbi:MAG: PadR family transcriptional regulator [Candidatus Thorarchaeota archaeon]